MRVLSVSLCPTAGLFLRGFMYLQTSASRDRWIQRIPESIVISWEALLFSLSCLSGCFSTPPSPLSSDWGCLGDLRGLWWSIRKKRKKTEPNIASFFPKRGTRNSYVIGLLLSSEQDLSAWCICSHLKQLQVTFMDTNYPAPTLKYLFLQRPRSPCRSTFEFDFSHSSWVRW